MRKIYPFIILILSLQACKSQQNQSTLNTPKIENYSKGELEIIATPFGLNGTKITVGKVSKDGSIHFNWPAIDIIAIENSDLYMGSIDRTLGMTFCNDKQIEKTSETAQTLKLEELSLYENEQYIGYLYPATDDKIRDNLSLNRHTSLVLGSTLNWYYSDSDVIFKASCAVNFESENTYTFKEVTAYDIQFKKGWNLVKHTLVEKEDWKNDSDQGSLPKAITKTSILTIPKTLNWYVKYVGM